LEDPEIAACIRKLRLVVFGFDGVLTDNTVLVFDDGTEAVRCWRGDGLGLAILRALGLPIVLANAHPAV
jgi:3-deoxy-D-manno-octulosonate 8-phosphate phosphatase KdsC-like HAD superfamily phosphatase